MADQRYIDFIEAIIKRTKAREIRWSYLDKNESLYKGMEWTSTKTVYSAYPISGKEVVVPDFNQEDSFCAPLGEMYIVIYVWRDRPAKLYIVPKTYKKVTVLPADEYGEYITRLSNLVQSQFPNAEIFIDTFLEKEKANKPD